MEISKRKERTLKTGEIVEELEFPIKLEIYTKCPNKWKLYDSETGQWYEGTSSNERGKQWKKIKINE